MSDAQNYIIVNNEAGSAISDGVTDLVRYIESRSKGEQTSLASLASEFKDQLDPQASEERPLPAATQPIFIKIAENADALLKSPPSEFEPAFNLLWYVLSSAPDFDAVIPVALSKLTASYPTVHAQQLALLAVLGSLFNITSPQSPQKPQVFTHILDLAVVAQAMNQIVPQLSQLAEWLQAWQISEDAKEKIVKKVIDNAGPQYHSQVLEFLKSVTKNQPELSGAASSLVSNVLGDSLAYDFEPLLQLPGVQALKGKNDLYDALQFIAVGDFTNFKKLESAIAENPTFIKKARVTGVAHLASSAKSSELTYSEISSALQLEDAKVEALIVDAIKAGLVRGRMNQLQQTFYVESATLVGEITDQHWDTIESRLTAWKKSLHAILEVSERARSNHDLVKTLNKLEVN